MKRSDARGYADLLIICLLSLADLLVYYMSGSSILTDILSILFLGFIPGYLMVELVPFLQKYDHIERLMISFAISAAIAVGSYYLSFSLLGPEKLVTAAFGSILVTEILTVVALYRRVNTKTDRKQATWMVIMKGLGSNYGAMGVRKKIIALASLVIIVVVIVASLSMLVSVSKERYSEFYILNEKGQAYDLPHDFTVGSQQQTILGVANHEGRTVKYFVEVWLVNYTMVDGGVTVKHMYSYTAMNITLTSTDVDLNSPWAPQYEGLVPLNFTIPGGYYLYFMLFKDSPRSLPIMPFNPTTDYSKDGPATNRIVDAVNNRIQYLRLNVNISSP